MTEETWLLRIGLTVNVGDILPSEFLSPMGGIVLKQTTETVVASSAGLSRLGGDEHMHIRVDVDARAAGHGVRCRLAER